MVAAITNNMDERTLKIRTTPTVTTMIYDRSIEYLRLFNFMCMKRNMNFLARKKNKTFKIVGAIPAAIIIIIYIFFVRLYRVITITLKHIVY
ncbi:Protein of unknown function [Cotesia congregata]|uniref:Uncharacterized protein n=1 Tax=Cotesia congregata TaxID=51543 RepID=A0A8J2HH49_COTCN|nr:Protein of unknown function [Cotesia congregata]